MSDFTNWAKGLAAKAKDAATRGLNSAKASNFGQTLSNNLASAQEGFSKTLESAKKKIDDVKKSTQQNFGNFATSPQNNNLRLQNSKGLNIHGGRRKTHKYKGGNFHAHSPSNGLAASASTVSGIRTASFKMVGGKRRRSNKHPCKKHHRNKHHHHTSKCRR